MHAQHITDQLKETKTITPNDTVIFGPMSPEKPNVRKLVQLFGGFLIKQYQSTIWVPNPAYPRENFLGSNTSQFLTNLLAETPDNPSGSYSAQIYPRNPSVNLSLDCVNLSLPHTSPASPRMGLHQPWEALHQPSGPLRQQRCPL